MLKLVILLAAFMASASAQCVPNSSLDITVPLQGSASIQSPNYPDNYPDSSNCQWLITGSNFSRPGLEINSDDFQLEGGGCSFDYLSVSQINNGGSDTKLGKFCGESGPQKLVAATNSIKILFRSDSSFNRRGFKLTIREPVCLSGSSLCPGSETQCIMLSQWCDGEENCQDGADEGPSCSVECGSTSIPPKEDKNAWRFRSLVAARAKGVDSRIVGGVEAEPHSLPWQIALLSNKGSQMCAGSIINNRWVMTAAHCCKAYAPLPSSYKVRVGAHIWSATDEPYAKTYDVEKLIVHPGYQLPSTFSNDFCLLKIDGMFEFGPHVGAICLADEDDCPAGSTALVSGWGSVSPARMGDPIGNFDEFIKHIKDAEEGLLAKEDDPNYESPRIAVLRQAYVEVTTQETCKAAYGTSITPNMICASRTGKDACQGDSGGPFVQKNSDGVWKLCGVVSFGRGCAQARYPGVYARVSTAIEWTMSTILSN